jgi:hypothetical protein
VLTKDDYAAQVIPYRMKAVAVFNLTTRYLTQWNGESRPLEIRFDGKVSIRGLSTAFTNPTIEAGIIHCRALLEFLGLRCDKKDPARLAQRQLKQRDDDLVIEDYSGTNGPLIKVTVAQALAAYTGLEEEAERALAAVIHTANKGLAHMTSGHIQDLGNLRLFEIASRGVPTLVANHFYVARGVLPPDWQVARATQDVA